METFVNFKIKFGFDDFFSIPKIRVGIDKNIYYDEEVSSLIEFDCELHNGSHTMWIEHYDKLSSWTTKCQDHHVYIKQIFFSDVDLDQISYHPLTHRGKFYPKYEPSYIESCKNSGITLPEFICPNHYLGHNGIWKLDFRAPELLWIIKEQNPSGINLEDTIFSTSSSTLNKVKEFFKL